jgi:hypothetical protein
VSADVYISGFAATAISVWYRDAMPGIARDSTNPVTALMAVFLVSAVWPVWLAATIVEALDL